MQYAFNRGSGGSFLVIEKETLSCGYERKMLECGALPYLLEEHIAHLDGTCELHYRISGMQTMEKRFAKQKMRTADVRGLLEQILRLRAECAAHLLPDTHLFLEPELIFYPYLESECRFLYVPEEETVFEVQLENLSDFMMKHVSYEPGDDDAVELVYSLQTAVQQDGFDPQIWWEAMKRSVLRETSGHTSAAAQPRHNTEQTSETDDRPGEKQHRLKMSAFTSDPAAYPGDALEIVPLTDDWDLRWADNDTQSSRLSGRFPVLEKIRNRKHRQKKRHTGKAAENRADFQESGPWEQAALYPEPDMPKPEPITNYAAPEDSVPQPDDTICLSEDGALPDDSVHSGRQHALIPIDGGSEIPLDRSFLLIGTAVRNVDIALQDRTVSRVHAEIFCDAAGVRIEDCNSSNGTMVNGQPLQPNEQRYLEPGMRIRMGRTEFLFR